MFNKLHENVQCFILMSSQSQSEMLSTTRVTYLEFEPNAVVSILYTSIVLASIFSTVTVFMVAVPHSGMGLLVVHSVHPGCQVQKGFTRPRV